MKNKLFYILSKICNIIAWTWVILLFVNKIILLIIELNKEPSFIHGLKRFWSIINPYELVFSANFWVFILLLLPASGLLKLGEYLKNQVETN